MSDLQKSNNETELAILNDIGFDGYVGMDDQDCMVTPRFMLAQSNSQATTRGGEKHIEGLQDGDFYNNIAGVVYGQKVDAVVLGMFPNVTKWGEGIGNFEGAMSPNEFRKIFDEGGLHNVKGKFFYTPNPKPNDAHFRKNINLIMFLPKYLEHGLMLFTASGTSHTPAKNLYNKMSGYKVGGRPCSYSKIWTLESVTTTKNGFTYSKLKGGTVGDDVLTNPTLYNFIKENVSTVRLWITEQANLQYDDSRQVESDGESTETTEDEF